MASDDNAQNPSDPASHPATTRLHSPVLVDLTPLNENDERVFYPLDLDSLGTQRSHPATPAPMAAPTGVHTTDFPDLPPAPASREVGKGYSSHNPVPTVQSYKITQANNEAQAKEYADIVAARQAEREERERQSEQRLQEQKDQAQHQNINETKQVDGEETNATKNNKDMKQKVDPHKPATEKERMMEQMNSNKSECDSAQSPTRRAHATVKPTDRFQKADKGERRVRDPITDAEIIVKDADPKGMSEITRARRKPLQQTLTRRELHRLDPTSCTTPSLLLDPPRWTPCSAS